MPYLVAHADLRTVLSTLKLGARLAQFRLSAYDASRLQMGDFCSHGLRASFPWSIRSLCAVFELLVGLVSCGDFCDGAA